MRSRLVFVNRYFHPDYSATSQMLSDLAFGLAERGYDVSVITSRQIYDDPDAKLAADETVEGVRIKRLPTTRFGRHRLLGRLVDYITFHAGVFFAIRRMKGSRITIAMTDPPLVSVTAALGLDPSGILVNWLQDLYPEVAEELGALGSGPVRLLSRARDWSLRRARANVVVGDRLRHEISAVDATAVVITNWSDGSRVKPMPQAESELASEWRLGESFVVGYSGNFGRAHEFDTLLGAAAALADSGVLFLLTGGGPRLPTLRREIERAGLQAMFQIRPYQPRERLSETLASSHVHLISLRSGLERFIVPSKFYGIAAAGRPAILVGERSGDLARAIEDHRCGIVVEPGDTEGLANAIRELREGTEARESMGHRARALFEAEFTKERAIERWSDLLDSIRPPG